MIMAGSLNLSSLNNRNLFPHGSMGWKSKINVAAGLVSSEGLPPQLVDGHLLFMSL